MCNGVVVVYLVKLRRTLTGNTYYLCRNTDGGSIIRYLAEYDSARCNTGIVADGKRTKHLCARTNEDIAAKGGVALALIFTCAAQRDSLIYHTAVTDHCGLANDYAVTVVYHNTPTDMCGRVYLDAGSSGGSLAEPTSRQLEAYAVKPICVDMRHNRLISGIEQPDLIA